MPLSARSCRPLVSGVVVKPSVALKLPVAGGRNVNWIWQRAPGLSVPVQALLTSENAAASAPLIPTPAMPIATFPTFVTVTVRTALVAPTGWVPKSTLSPLTLGGMVPTPLKAADCGLFGALSVNCTLAVAVPGPAGAKATMTVQEAPGAREAGQLFVPRTNEPLWPPVRATPPRVSDAPPVLVRVTDASALMVPTR